MDKVSILSAMQRLPMDDTPLVQNIWDGGKNSYFRASLAVVQASLYCSGIKVNIAHACDSNDGVASLGIPLGNAEAQHPAFTFWKLLPGQLGDRWACEKLPMNEQL